MALPPAKLPRRKYQRRVKLEDAKGWYSRFNDDRSIISENGARYFAFLLGEVERLKRKAGEQ